MHGFGFFKAAALSLGAVLVGCADAQTGGVVTSGQAPQNRCDAQAVQALVGAPWDDAKLAQARAAAGADEARLLHPDSVITKELKPGRLNVVVDENGRVVRVYCG